MWIRQTHRQFRVSRISYGKWNDIIGTISRICIIYVSTPGQFAQMHNKLRKHYDFAISHDIIVAFVRLQSNVQIGWWVYFQWRAIIFRALFHQRREKSRICDAIRLAEDSKCRFKAIQIWNLNIQYSYVPLKNAWQRMPNISLVRSLAVVFNMHH